MKLLPRVPFARAYAMIILLQGRSAPQMMAPTVSVMQSLARWITIGGRSSYRTETAYSARWRVVRLIHYLVGPLLRVSSPPMRHLGSEVGQHHAASEARLEARQLPP